MTGSELFLFVSHVSEDRAAATEIVDELERRGVRCWIAPRDVQAGRPFDDEIAAAIDASRAMLLVFSERCNESEYIRREVTVAGESQKLIIPFRIEDAQPRRGLRVRLSDLHWIDGFASRERAIDELAGNLAASSSEGGDYMPRVAAQRQGLGAPSDGEPTSGTLRPGLRWLAPKPAIAAGIIVAVISATLLVLALTGYLGRPVSQRQLPIPSESLQSPSLRTLTGHTDRIEAVAFSPMGQMLASGSDDRTIKLWDLRSGRMLRSLSGHTETVGSVTFSPDGQTLATASDDKTVKLWNVATGQAIFTLTGHTDYVTAVAFSHDGRFLASGSDDKTVRLWDVASGHFLRMLSHSDRVGTVAFSPSGDTLASGTDDKTIELWDATSGQPLRTLLGHTDRVEVVAFSENGRSLAYASDDTTIKLWDWTTGRVLRTLAGHTEAVEALAFSPDGGMLVTASHDHTMKLWNPSSGEPLRTLRQDVDTLCLAFSPDGQTIAAGSEDRAVRLWEVAKLAR